MHRCRVFNSCSCGFKKTTVYKWLCLTDLTLYVSLTTSLVFDLRQPYSLTKLFLFWGWRSSSSMQPSSFSYSSASPPTQLSRSWRWTRTDFIIFEIMINLYFEIRELPTIMLTKKYFVILEACRTIFLPCQFSIRFDCLYQCGSRTSPGASFPILGWGKSTGTALGQSKKICLWDRQKNLSARPPENPKEKKKTDFYQTSFFVIEVMKILILLIVLGSVRAEFAITNAFLQKMQAFLFSNHCLFQNFEI